VKRKTSMLVSAAAVVLLAVPSADANTQGMGTGCSAVNIGGGPIEGHACGTGRAVYSANGAFWSITSYDSKYWVADGAFSHGCHDNETSVGPVQGYRSGTGAGGFNSADSGCSDNTWIHRTGYGTSTTYPGQTVFQGKFWFDVTDYPDPGWTLDTAVF